MNGPAVSTELGAVSRYVLELVRRQVDEHGLVIWFDPEKHYEGPQVIDLLSNGVGFDAGVAVFVALHSALRQAEVQPASVCIGDLTVQGTVRGVPALGDVLRICMDNGARRALLPLEARRALLEVEATVLEHVDAVFYGDPVAAAAKSVATGT